MPPSEGGASDADVWQDPTAKVWIRQVLEGMAPKMADSTLVTQIVPREGDYSEGDVKFWVELGACIMMNKPVVAIAETGQVLPPKLELIADEIVYIDPGDLVSQESADRIKAGMERLVDRLGL
jgi:hypothetical protein